MSNELKYTILERLQKMPFCEYQKARKDLPNKLGVHPDTLKRWFYIRQSSASEISADMLLKLAEYFQCQPAELYNQVPTLKP